MATFGNLFGSKTPSPTPTDQPVQSVVTPAPTPTPQTTVSPAPLVDEPEQKVEPVAEPPIAQIQQISPAPVITDTAVTDSVPLVITTPTIPELQVDNLFTDTTAVAPASTAAPVVELATPFPKQVTDQVEAMLQHSIEEEQRTIEQEREVLAAKRQAIEQQKNQIEQMRQNIAGQEADIQQQEVELTQRTAKVEEDESRVSKAIQALES